MNKKQVIVELTKLATNNLSRRSFNKAVHKNFKQIGSGACRLVYDAGNSVIKIRRFKKICPITIFDMKKINNSNLDEYTMYLNICINAPKLSPWLLKPEYFILPNNHDVVIMKKVETPIKLLDNHINNQIIMLQDIFEDAHDDNLGILQNRVYVIDLNHSGYNTEYSKNKNYQAVCRQLKKESKYGL